MFWKVEARRVADKLIIQKDPERFLAGEFAREVFANPGGQNWERRGG